MCRRDLGTEEADCHLIDSQSRLFVKITAPLVSRIDSAFYSNPSQLLDRRYNRGAENRHSLCTMTLSKNPARQFLTETSQRNCWDFSRRLQVAITTIQIAYSYLLRLLTNKTQVTLQQQDNLCHRILGTRGSAC